MRRGDWLVCECSAFCALVSIGGDGTDGTEADCVGMCHGLHMFEEPSVHSVSGYTAVGDCVWTGLCGGPELALATVVWTVG